MHTNMEDHYNVKWNSIDVDELKNLLVPYHIGKSKGEHIYQIRSKPAGRPTFNKLF